MGLLRLLVSGTSSLYLLVNLILVVGTSSSIFDSRILSPVTSSSFVSPQWSSITPSLFHTRLKTCLFYKFYPVVSLLSPGLPLRAVPAPFLLSYSVFSERVT